MYMPAIVGPIDAPIILISVDIPSETPTDCFGVANITIFIAPTFVKERPADKIAKFTATRDSVEWNKKREQKPAAPIILPAMIGFIEPSLEIIKPDVGPNINNTNANGN